MVVMISQIDRNKLAASSCLLLRSILLEKQGFILYHTHRKSEICIMYMLSFLGGAERFDDDDDDISNCES